MHFYSAREEIEEPAPPKAAASKRGHNESGNHGAAFVSKYADASLSQSAGRASSRCRTDLCHSCARSLRSFAHKFQDAKFVRRPSTSSQSIGKCSKDSRATSQDKDSRCVRSCKRSSYCPPSDSKYRDCRPLQHRACNQPAESGSHGSGKSFSRRKSDVRVRNGRYQQQRAFFEYQRRSQKKKNAAGPGSQKIQLLSPNTTTVVSNHVPIAASPAVGSRTRGCRSDHNNILGETWRIQESKGSSYGPLERSSCNGLRHDGRYAWMQRVFGDPGDIFGAGLEAPPSNVISERVQTMPGITKPFNPLVPQSWAACTLAYIKEMDILTNKKVDLRGGGRGKPKHPPASPATTAEDTEKTPSPRRRPKFPKKPGSADPKAA